MTGYGSTSFQIDELEIYIELKTLNSRYFDSKISMPSALSSQELLLNNLLKEKLIRGKVDLRIKLTGSTSDVISFNKSVIKNYINDLKELSDFDDSQILKSVLSLPNSIDKGELSLSTDQINKLNISINNVIEEVIKFRKNEGENTLKDLRENLNIIKEYSEIIDKISDLHKKNIKEELQIKSQNLEVNFDNARFEQEVFYYLEKMDINEELVRLKSHMDFFIEILDNDLIEKGKKLGFICQEIGREINTIGSKSSNSKIQNSVVEMKSSLEKIREQTLNIL
ncbi:MAG: DUF1732 domain-containing protein [Flavobacteriaceae bacterium]|jgi:uncharacterized protein (TIGR00255 family)|nr:DUF1732 domain-containing protein [Flavobacteriaceae bacterium]MBL6684576.1 DUF1732 domain-containing protein [Flavobacteriaceae bacterium]